jgi:hypothetical protein
VIEAYTLVEQAPVGGPQVGNFFEHCSTFEDRDGTRDRKTGTRRGEPSPLFIYKDQFGAQARDQADGSSIP